MTVHLLTEQTKRLSQLRVEDFERFPAWTALPELIQELDKELTPVLMGAEDVLPATLGETWCKTDAQLSCGKRLPAFSLCYPDGSGGPILWTVFQAGKYVSISVPPAPVDELSMRGPAAFARLLGIRLEDVIPITFTVVPSFEKPPTRRAATLDLSGVVVAAKDSEERRKHGDDGP